MVARSRVGLVFAGALLFGLVAAWLKGPGGADEAAAIRAAIGDMSTPWLLVAFVSGTQCTRVRGGAMLGLLATMTALLSFYVLTSLLVDVGDGRVLESLTLWLTANRIWFETGLISGLAFGALGAWWVRRRTYRTSVLVGALLMLEPLAWLVTTHAQSLDVQRFGIWVTEFAVGLAVLVLASVRARSRRPAGTMRRMAG